MTWLNGESQAYPEYVQNGGKRKTRKTRKSKRKTRKSRRR